MCLDSLVLCTNGQKEIWLFISISISIPFFCMSFALHKYSLHLLIRTTCWHFQTFFFCACRLSQLEVFGAVIKTPAFTPPLPLRNYLTVQFVPYALSRLPLSEQLLFVWLYSEFFCLFLAGSDPLPTTCCCCLLPQGDDVTVQVELVWLRDHGTICLTSLQYVTGQNREWTQRMRLTSGTVLYSGGDKDVKKSEMCFCSTKVGFVFGHSDSIYSAVMSARCVQQWQTRVWQRGRKTKTTHRSSHSGTQWICDCIRINPVRGNSRLCKNRGKKKDRWQNTHKYECSVIGQ